MSLFSGAMGLDIGLENAGFDVVVTNDFDKQMCSTIKLNRPDVPVIEGDIQKVTGKQIRDIAKLGNKEVDVLVGGPPCQAFSVYGKRKGIEDPRGAVIYDFVRLVKELKPKVFLMENVRGLLSMKLTKSDTHGSLLRDIQNELGKIGYRTECYVVNAVNYGAPQIRERILLLGNRFGVKSIFPERTHSDIASENLKPFATLGDALKGLKEKEPAIMDFSERKKKYLRMVPEGENWRSLPTQVQKESMGKAWYLKGGRSAYWRRLSFSFPSPTVVTMPNHAGTSMCHPKNTRPLSVRECARVQGFPDNWEFSGTVSDQYKQIGNAVPTKLGEIAGVAIKNLLSQIEKKSTKRAGKNEIEHSVIHLRPHVRTRQYYKNGQKTGAVSYRGGVATFFKEVNQTRDQKVPKQLELIPT